MRSVVVVASLLLVLLLDAVASFRIIRSEVLSPRQTIAWLLFAWLVPIVGAMLALQLSRETLDPLRPNASEPGSSHVVGTGVSGGAGGGGGFNCGPGGGSSCGP